LTKIILLGRSLNGWTNAASVSDGIPLRSSCLHHSGGHGIDGGGATGSGYDGGRLIGFLLGLTVIPALITGFLARRAETNWSRVKIAVVYVIVLFAVALFYIIGKLPPHQ
jgi:hypothetical protein